MLEFFQTRMGQRFFESTAPSIAQELSRLNDNIERIIALIEREKPKQEDSHDQQNGKGD